jgi:filamentous hemagglutinin family protein
MEHKSSLTGARGLLVALSASLVCGTAHLALAGGLPSGGTYVAGSGTIGGTGHGLTIDQSTSRGIIDWKSFSIAGGHSVQFDNGSGATLNVVSGSDLSKIAGGLHATGSVFLINGNGVVISASGKVVTGGSFIASTRPTDTAAFMAGDPLRFSGNSSGAVENAGHITSSGGDAILIGDSVSNSGAISAPRGTAGLAAGNDILLQPAGSGAPISVRAGHGDVRNTGAIAAVQAELAAANGNVYALAGNAGGIEATGTRTVGGHVWLTSNAGGTRISGTVSARDADGTGGTIVATGRSVALSGDASLSADGVKGGGTILVGGDEHGGKNPSAKLLGAAVANARTTRVGRNVHISANATEAGKGGHIVVWSDDRTALAGTVSAQGGARGGDGGKAEISSHRSLDFTGHVDMTAAHGMVGRLLLDPGNLTISTASSARVHQQGSNFSGTGNDSILNVSTLTSALASANVKVATSATGTQAGDLTVATNIAWSGSHSLTLQAYRNINLGTNVRIVNNGSANLTLFADEGAQGSGLIRFQSGSRVNWANSTGNVTIYYRPSSFPTSTDYSGRVSLHSGSTLMAYMNVDSLADMNLIYQNLTGDYALNANLDAQSIANFTMIGSAATPFAGIFDGRNHTIDNLTIKNTDAVGLFAYNSGTIKNLGLTNVTIVGKASSDRVGALVGENSGHVISSYATGSLRSLHGKAGGLAGTNSGSILSSHAAVAVLDNDTLNIGFTYIGGLVAINTGTINKSYAAGTVKEANLSSADDEIGGLVGWNDGGAINRSHATGHVIDNADYAYAGGLVGYSGYNTGATIANSYATGSVQANGYSSNVGGLAGTLINGATISNSHATGAVSAGGDYANAGGLLGDADALYGAVSVTSSYASGNVSSGNDGNAGGLVGDNFSGATISNSQAYGNASSGTNADAGGLVGINYGTIESSSAGGSASGGGGSDIGGLVGYNSGTISGSTSAQSPLCGYNAGGTGC